MFAKKKKRLAGCDIQDDFNHQFPCSSRIADENLATIFNLQQYCRQGNINLQLSRKKQWRCSNMLPIFFYFSIFFYLVYKPSERFLMTGISRFFLVQIEYQDLPWLWTMEMTGTSFASSFRIV